MAKCFSGKERKYEIKRPRVFSRSPSCLDYNLIDPNLIHNIFPKWLRTYCITPPTPACSWHPPPPRGSIRHRFWSVNTTPKAFCSTLPASAHRWRPYRGSRHGFWSAMADFPLPLPAVGGGIPFWEPTSPKKKRRSGNRVLRRPPLCHRLPCPV